jgi:hypothetical protein
VQSQAARHILKDYVNGVLVYSHSPPAANSGNTFEDHHEQLQKEKDNFEKEEDQL